MGSDVYQLVKLANGSFSIRSLADGETFHPVAGPMAEAETLYVRQLRLRERLHRCEEEFVIWDVGLGAGGNVGTALRCTAAIDSPLRIISFDRTTAALQFALDHAAELEFLRGFEEPARDLLRSSRATIPGRRATWEHHPGDFPDRMREAAEALRNGGPRMYPAPHAIFFDAFSPARNPEMWTLPLLRDMHAQLEKPCMLATFSRSTLARTALLLAGFFVAIGEPLAGKEETTVASNAPGLLGLLLGQDWLARARRSHAAEPLQEGRHVLRPLSEKSWQRLKEHPQFAHAHPHSAS